MKNKNKKHQKPFHLHVEHFFRKKYIVLGMLAFLAIAILRADAKTMSVMREAYAQGYGLVGQYMREETTRLPMSFEIGVRAATHSGR